MVLCVKKTISLKKTLKKPAKKISEEIHEDVEELVEDVEDIAEDVEDIKEDLSIIQKGQKTILKSIRKKFGPDKFEFDDFAQQIVGALILSSPLAVTEEVWLLANALDPLRVTILIVITLLFDILLIYYTNYRFEGKKNKLLNVSPIRLFSQLIVSYITATIILLVFGIIGGPVNSLMWSVKLVILVGLFANIGAGTADLIK
jgi:uncharacterized membrane protein